MGLNACDLTAMVAVKLAKHMGCESIDMYAFDAVTNGNLYYAPSIDADPTQGGELRRFRAHGSRIQRLLEEDFPEAHRFIQGDLPVMAFAPPSRGGGRCPMCKGKGCDNCGGSGLIP
jgi:hypothetical protein